MWSLPLEKLPLKVVAAILIIAGIYAMFSYDLLRGAGVVAGGVALLLFSIIRKQGAAAEVSSSAANQHEK